MAMCLICKRSDVVLDDCLFGFVTSRGETICCGCYYRETQTPAVPPRSTSKAIAAAANAAEGVPM